MNIALRTLPPTCTFCGRNEEELFQLFHGSATATPRHHRINIDISPLLRSSVKDVHADEHAWAWELDQQRRYHGTVHFL